MADVHKSFLEPFFKEMNIKYHNEWCVLHSYETLPLFSESDVDMAFSSNDTRGLENLIHFVALKSGWQVLQKLWYDVETCCYYVLKNKSNEIFLALDFLIDSKGLGRYGFKSAILTKDCKMLEAKIPVPNHEVAFTYIFIKRLIKKRKITEDSKYMDYHYSKSNKYEIRRLLEDQLGNKSSELITKCFKNTNYLLDENDYCFLLKNQTQLLSQKNIFIRKYLNLKRISFRFFHPSGMIVYVPISQKEKLELFKSALEEKMSIAFRFIKLNSSNSMINKIKLMAGSTLLICETNGDKNIGKITWSWLKTKKIKLEPKNLNDIDFLSEAYREEIIKTLVKRTIIRAL